MADPYGFDDGEGLNSMLAGVVSPAPAAQLVGPPPDGVPDHKPGQSTPLTGNLAAPPKQSIAKNLDTPQGRSAYSGISNPPSGGYVTSTASPVQASQPTRPAQAIQQAQPAYQPGVPLATQQANRMQAYKAGPGPAQYAASQTPVSMDIANPDPNASLRPGGPSPAVPAALPAQNSPQPVQGPSQLEKDQSRLNYLTSSGSGIDQIQNKPGRIAARIGDIAVQTLFPGVAAATPGFTAHHQQLVGQAQGIVGNDQAQIQQAAATADTQQQTAERAALAQKADALAQADAPQPLSKEKAAALGHPELEGEPMTQRAYTQLASAHEGATSREQVGAGHDVASITRTDMRDQTSTANNAASNTSREAITAARDKTQALLGQLRASVSTENNERTNQTHLTTSGMRSATGSAAGQPGNYKVPADVTKRAALANNVQENAGEVSKLLDSNPDIVGAIAGRYTNTEQMIGNDNPAISALGTRIHNIALAANGAHGVRSAEAVHATERELLNNFHNGPNAIKGALNATTSSVQTFLDDEKNYRQTGGRVAPAASPIPNAQTRDPNMLYARDPQGKLHAAPKEGAKPLPPGWKYDVQPAGGR